MWNTETPVKNPGHTKFSFREWLREQEGRQDPVGDFARDVLLDTHYPGGNSLHYLDEYLAERGASADAREALGQAHEEWRKLLAAGLALVDNPRSRGKRVKRTQTVLTGNGQAEVESTDLDELARRLAAAWFSYQLGNKSIDYTLKVFVLNYGDPDDCSPGPFWRSIAHAVADGQTR